MSQEIDEKKSDYTISNIKAISTSDKNPMINSAINSFMKYGFVEPVARKIVSLIINCDIKHISFNG